jgi:regulator of cell morphogenesis and NO signaling
LEQACRDKGLDVGALVHELATAELPAAERDHFDALGATLGSLIDHIVADHHAYLKRELPRLAELVEKVESAHGARHPELAEIREIFAALKDELLLHLLKEEKILFPMIKQLDLATEMPHFYCVTSANPIRVMEREHEETGVGLARLRAITGSYEPPADDCATYRAMLDGLAELEMDLHLHIHEENNILFPRARAAEDALLRVPTEIE